MNIRPIMHNLNNVAFKKSQEYRDVLLDKKSFYKLNTDEKLNVIYDTLTGVDDNCDRIQQNQRKNTLFNYEAFKLLASYSWKEKEIDKAFNKV